MVEAGDFAQNKQSKCNEAIVSLTMADVRHPTVEFKLLYSDTKQNLPHGIAGHVDYK